MIRLLTILISLIQILLSQSIIGEWESHTSPLENNDIVRDGNTIYTATYGGLLKYDINNNLFDTYTNIHGITNTSITKIARDSTGIIWLGGGNPNGTIQLYHDGESVHVFDFELTEILDIQAGDSLVFVAFKMNQDFGIMEFRLRENGWIYKDAYQNWPLSIQQIVGIGFIDKYLFLATDRGILSADYYHDNLKNPSSWSIYEEFESPVQSCYFANHGFYFQTDNDIHGIKPESGLESIHDYFNYGFKQMAVSDSGIVWGTLSNKLIRLGETHKEEEIVIASNSSLSLDIMENGLPILGTKNGVGIYEESTLIFARPNAPLTNDFSSIKVLSDGRILGGSKKGLAIKEDWGWRNIIGTTSNDTIVHESFTPGLFAADTIPVHFGDYIADIEEGPDGLVYLAIRGTYPEPIRHGGGIVILDIDNPTNYTLIDTAYLDHWFTGGNANPYLVVQDITFDSRGYLWVADTYARRNHNSVTVLDGNMNQISFSADMYPALSLTSTTVEVDAWGRAWVGAFEGEENGSYTNGGFVMINLDGNDLPSSTVSVHAKTINPPGEDGVSRTIWDMAITSDNRLYAVTPTGLEYVDLQSSDSDPIRAYSTFTYFPNIAFTQFSKVELDAEENAWTSSPVDGIHVLLKNASFWPDYDPDLVVESINTETSHLLSNTVTDIAFDHEKGLAVISTNRGISTLKIPFVEADNDYESVRVFPSPFVLSKHSHVIFDGLMGNSSAQVLSLDGRVLKKLKHVELGIHGNQIRWDGRLENGDLAGSGVYLISLYDESGNQSFEKLTIIR